AGTPTPQPRPRSCSGSPAPRRPASHAFPGRIVGKAKACREGEDKHVFEPPPRKAPTPVPRPRKALASPPPSRRSHSSAPAQRCRPVPKAPGQKVPGPRAAQVQEAPPLPQVQAHPGHPGAGWGEICPWRDRVEVSLFRDCLNVDGAEESDDDSLIYSLTEDLPPEEIRPSAAPRRSLSTPAIRREDQDSARGRAPLRI
ncbi:HERC2, partial [Symbiodinium sp. KB8]